MMIATILGHHDALLRLEQEDDIGPFLDGNSWTHLDLPRVEDAGISASFFACWVPQPEPIVLDWDSSEGEDDFSEVYDENEDGFLIPEQDELSDMDDEDEVSSSEIYDDEELVELDDPIDPDYARDYVDSMILRLYELQEASGGQLLVATTADELEDCRESGRHAAILHFEGAEPLSGDVLSWLDHYYSLGLRSVGLVWSRSNEFGTGVPFRYPSSPDTGPGLSESGKELVLACNDLGVLIDLSHLNEAGFWDVARLSRHPLVATHSNAHALCPSARNLTDEQLLAIRDSGGIVGVNFCTSDLRNDGADDEDTELALVLEQIDYLVETMGVDCVGLGTDYDGAIVPSMLSDVSYLPILWDILIERGYEVPDLEAMAYGNWERVIRATWGDGL